MSGCDGIGWAEIGLVSSWLDRVDKMDGSWMTGMT